MDRKTKEKLLEIERLEYHYFRKIDFDLSQDLGKMIEGLNSKDKIKDDWIEFFNRVGKKRQNSDFARGAERIYFWLFNQFGRPNSSPIGADLFFETQDAFVHIDIKTAKLSNPADYKGKIPLSENQTSYKSSSKKFRSNLPTFYNKGKKEEKICITYVINIIYDDSKKDFKIVAINLISVPNGELFKVYGNKIIGGGKNKGKSFRFEYKNDSFFSLLKEKPRRIKNLHIDKGYKAQNLVGIKI